MVLKGLRRICERGVLGFAFWATPAAAQSSPTVTGPEGGAHLRVPELPGPTTHSLSHAIRLNFDGGCISARPLVNEVGRWLGEERIDNRITVEVSGAQNPLRAHFWLLVEDERRALRRFEDFSGTCEELAKSLAAAIALAIEAVELPPRERTLPPVVNKPQPWSLPMPKRRARPAPGQPVVRSFGIAAHGLFAIGATYGPAWGGGLRTELGLPLGASMRLGGHYLGAGAERLAQGSVGSHTFSGELGACWGGAGAQLLAKVCMDTWVGTLHVEARDIIHSGEADLMTFSLGPGAELRLPSGEGLGAYLGAYGLFNLSRPRVEVRMNTRDRVLAQLQLPPFGFLVALGVDATWL